MNTTTLPTSWAAVRPFAATAFALLASFQAHAIVVTPTGDALALANSLIGAGVTIDPLSVSLTGGNLGNNDSSAGFFTGGLTTGIGIDTGILLTSGYARNVGNVNTMDGITGSFGGPGDAALTALSGDPTFDATILEFDFTTTTGDLFFNFAFASDEYNEFVNQNVNDVFGFFVNGNNIALVPGTSTPISIDTVNSAVNSSFYNNNDLDDGGSFAFEYDGFTDVFTVSAVGLGAGTHTIRLAIADGGDLILDSGVFIQAGSFTPTPPPPPNGVPDSGSTLLLAGLGATLLATLRRLRKN